MELKTYWRVFLRRWWLVAAPVLVVLVYILVAYRSPPTFYQVVMRFSAGTDPAGLSEDYDRYYPWLTSEYIANGLADVAETGVFAQAIAARLAVEGVAVEPGTVQGAIVTDNAQSILVVYLTWPDANQARVVAGAIADELTQSGDDYFPQLDGLDPAVSLLDDPVPAAVAPSLRVQLLGPAVRLGLALAVGIGLAILWHYLDPTVREAEELETLGFQVLARVPQGKKRTGRRR